jgi:hypothetical protein
MKNQTLSKIIQKILEEWNPIGVPDEIADVEYLDYIPCLIQTAHNKEETKRRLVYILRQMGYNKNLIRNKKVQQDLEIIAQRIFKEYLKNKIKNEKTGDSE